MPTELIANSTAYLRRRKPLLILWRALNSVRRNPVGSLYYYRQRLRDYQHNRAEMERQRIESKSFPYRPLISVLMPTHDSDPVRLRSTIESIQSQTYPNWELCLVSDSSSQPAVAGVINRRAAKDARIKVTLQPTHSSSAVVSNTALHIATGEFVALLAPGDQLAPEALYAVAKLLNQHPEADLIYTDEDKIRSDGTRFDPLLKPDWSPEYFLSEMYTRHLSVYRHAMVRDVGAFRENLEGAHEYDLALRIVERSENIHHIPQVLYHRRVSAQLSEAYAPAEQRAAQGAQCRALTDYLRRNQIAATCEDAVGGASHRVRYRIVGQPLVSIIIPTAGFRRMVGNREVDLVANCVQSIVRKTEYQNYEILCVVDGELREETKHALGAQDGAPIRLIPFTKPFNFAEKMNFGVRHARGAHFLFLNDDMEAVSGEWLTALLEFSQQQAVGAVGAKLYFPNGAIQHAGVVLTGVGPHHVFYRYPKDQQEGVRALNVVCNYSAVTGACLMTRREVFEQVAGFNEAFAVNYNDVDYCLKVRERGYRVVYTPYAELLHFESVSRSAFKSDGIKPEEIKLFDDTWRGRITRDPYYNPMLDLIYFNPLFMSGPTEEGGV